MNIDITPVLEALIALAAALVAGRLLPWLRERLTAQRMERLEAACNVAVYAAEELFRAGHGQEKLNYAQEYLKSRGLEVDTARLLAAVRRMREAGLEEGKGAAGQESTDEAGVGAERGGGAQLAAAEVGAGAECGNEQHPATADVADGTAHAAETHSAADEVEAWATSGHEQHPATTDVADSTANVQTPHSSSADAEAAAIVG